MWYKELKEIRLAIGMQAKELAEKVGKSATYISRIESGAILNTSFDIVSSIARVIADNEKIKSGEVDLNKGDIDLFETVARYRVAERNFNDAKKELEQAILMDSKKNNFNQVVKMYEKEGYRLILPMKDKIEVEDVIKGNYNDFLEILTNEMRCLTENIKLVGIDELIEMNQYPSEIDNDYEDKEVILEEPVDGE